MPQRRPVAFHLVWGCYGFWLPNDPRGSWSRYVGSRRLYEIGGRATTVSTGRSLAHDAHDRALRLRTKRALRSPPVRFTGPQAAAVGAGLAAAIAEAGYIVHACCIMPDHVHLVIADHARHSRQIIGHLKARATQALNASEMNPRRERTPWSKRGWVVYLWDEHDVRRAVRYVESNPVEVGLPRQRWSFVRAPGGLAPRKRGG